MKSTCTIYEDLLTNFKAFARRTEICRNFSHEVLAGPIFLTLLKHSWHDSGGHQNLILHLPFYYCSPHPRVPLQVHPVDPPTCPPWQEPIQSGHHCGIPSKQLISGPDPPPPGATALTHPAGSISWDLSLSCPRKGVQPHPPTHCNTYGEASERATPGTKPIHNHAYNSHG